MEDCLGPVLTDYAVEAVNALTARARELTPSAKILISPYGIFNSDFDNPRWTRYAPGTHEVILENKGPELVVRMLNSHKDDIVPPSKLFLFTSEDGEKWTLDCIKDTPAWVNTNHDAFVDLMVFDIDAKHIKLAFTVEYEAYMEVRLT